MKAAFLFLSSFLFSSQSFEQNHPRLEAKTYDFTLSTYDVTGTVIDKTSIEFEPGQDFTHRINLGSRNEYLTVIEAKSQFYAYDCEFGLQDNPNSKIYKIKEKTDVCGWPYREITEKIITTKIDIREVPELLGESYLVLECQFSYFRVEIDAFKCESKTTGGINNQVVDQTYFDFDEIYEQDQLEYVLEIIFTWIFKIIEAVMFAANPCL